MGKGGGGKGGGKGKGKGGGKGKGKGKGKGGKGGGRTQTRRELSSVVGEVFRDAGEYSLHPRDGGGKRGASSGAGAGIGPSRKVLRKNKRKEQKIRRTHFFGEGRRRQDDDVRPTKGRSASDKDGDHFGKPGHAAAAGEKQGKKPQQKGKKRRRADDDDEEITSEEEGGGGQSGPAAKRKAAAGAAERSEDEGEEEEEDAAAGDDGAANVDAEAEADGGAAAGVASSRGAYVPPHLRGAAKAKAEAAGSAAAGAVALLNRQIRGTMNRVTEGNLDPSARELSAALSKLVPQVGSAAAAGTFMGILLPAAVADPNMSLLVLGCYAALAAAAHVSYGPAFGAAALVQGGQWLGRRLSLAEVAHEATGEDARIAKNCVAFEALLFSFGVLPGSAMFDMVRFIFDGGLVTEVRIELVLTALRYAGRGLRAECPDGFKEMLAFVTTTVSASQSSKPDIGDEPDDKRTRAEYLMRELQDLKNNKVSFAAMDRFEPIRSWLKSAPVLGGRKVSDHQLRVPFKFLEEEPPPNWPAGTRGGASSSTTVGGGRRDKGSSGGSGGSAEALRAVAISQRLSTELRQNLFVALMGAEDFEHAADRLAHVAAAAKLGPSEACLVLFHCAVREKVPNPFYEHVAAALCGRPAPWGKRFAHFMKRATVQHLQQAHTYGLRAIVALAELAAALVAAPDIGVPLNVLRFVRFGELEAARGAEASGKSGGAGGAKLLGGTLGLLLRHFMESLLRRVPDAEAAGSVFEVLAKYDDVREGMLLVLDSLVKPRLPPRAEAPQLWEKFQVVRRKLASRVRSEEV